MLTDRSSTQVGMSKQNALPAVSSKYSLVRASSLVCGVCVGEFELVRFVFWVALHPEEVDLLLDCPGFSFGLVCEFVRNMSEI